MLYDILYESLINYLSEEQKNVLVDIVRREWNPKNISREFFLDFNNCFLLGEEMFIRLEREFQRDFEDEGLCQGLILIKMSQNM